MEANTINRFEEAPEKEARNYFLIVGYAENPVEIEMETRRAVAKCPVFSAEEKKELNEFLSVFHYTYFWGYSRFFVNDASDRIISILIHLERGRENLLGLFYNVVDMEDCQLSVCREYIIEHAEQQNEGLWSLVTRFLQDQMNACSRMPWEHDISNDRFRENMQLRSLLDNHEIEMRLGRLGVSVHLDGAARHERVEETDDLKEWLKKWTPKKIKQYLDTRMIGQDQAKKVVAGAVYMHVLSLLVKDQTDGIRSVRNNILLLGPTGSGKTYIARLVSRILPKGITVCFLDGSNLTPEAYRGASWADSLIRKRKELLDDGISLERSILFVDEVDKLLLKNEIDDSPSVISQMLTCLEGTDDALVGDRDHFKRGSGLKTERMSFFFAGAFEEVIRDAKGGRKTCGFVSSNQDKGVKWKVTDLREKLLTYGIRDEFEGRISEIATLSRLSDAEISALVENEIYPELTAMCEAAGANLTILPDARARLGEILLDKPQFGVRGLQNMLLGIMYEEMRDGVINKAFVIGPEQVDKLLSKTVTW